MVAQIYNSSLREAGRSLTRGKAGLHFKAYLKTSEPNGKDAWGCRGRRSKRFRLKVALSSFLHLPHSQPISGSLSGARQGPLMPKPAPPHLSPHHGQQPLQATLGPEVPLLSFLSRALLALSWQVLALARQQNKKVKVVGGGHSPSDIACTDGFMIHMGKMNRILQVPGPLTPLLSSFPSFSLCPRLHV